GTPPGHLPYALRHGRRRHVRDPSGCSQSREASMTNQAPQANRPPEAVVYQMLDGFKVTQALYAASMLSIFDVLHDKPLTPPERAAAVGAHAPSLLRLLRFLTSINILAEDDHQRFTAT